MLRFIRRREVLAQCGTTDSGLDRLIRDGFMPPPIKLSPDPRRRAVAWPQYEIEELIAARISGLGADATRALVSQLIERRNPTREVA